MRFLLGKEPYLLGKIFLRSLGVSEFLQEISSGAKASFRERVKMSLNEDRH